ncbi:MAG: type II toxin-antitoxin system RelE/ParE family toxin [Rhodospirillales bacterium]|nr:type II toxin-antitoxin system RelE/ParE family toxin [Rhodospirillales bacterium]
MIEVKIYKTEMGVEPFSVWFETLKSSKAKSAVARALTKMEAGLLNDVKSVGDGVQEYRIHFEKGYRIYFGNDGGEIIILLSGSDKKAQNKEIENAKNYWEDYKRQKKQRRSEANEKCKRPHR